MRHLLTGSAIAIVSLLLCGALEAKRAQAPQGAPAGLGTFDLVRALKDTPGCLGVETAQTPGGKSAIFAWFENKAAVVGWYYGETHQSAIASFAAGSSFGGGDEPLAHVDDDAGPILCIASLTPSSTPKVEHLSLPVSQIAIELYQPLPGGIAVGGKFAPAKLKVPHLREIALPSGH